MAFYIVFSALLGGLMGWYAYRYIRRSLLTFGSDVTKKHIKIPILTASAVIGAGCANIGSIGTILFLHILFISLFLRLINYITKKIFKGSVFNKYREKVFQSGIIPVLVSLAVIFAGYINMHNVVKTEYTVFTEKNISKDYKIALVADVHYGVSLDKKAMDKKCAEISSHNPDVVILAGDITDSDTSKNAMEEVFDCLGKIKSNYGIFYVYGNHDRSMLQMKNKYSDDELKSAIEKNGIIILKDNVTSVNNEIRLIGRDDAFTNAKSDRRSLKDLMRDVPKDDYIINIDHQPREYRESAELNLDLVLSGHTHGGQIWPADIVQKIFNINEGVYGCSKIGTGTQTVITSGFAGWAYPVKNSAPAEYVIINIKKP